MRVSKGVCVPAVATPARAETHSCKPRAGAGEGVRLGAEPRRSGFWGATVTTLGFHEPHPSVLLRPPPQQRKAARNVFL